MAIHLGSPSPATSCGSPGTNQRAVAFLLSLAPGGVYRAAPVTRGAGGLLHHRFTLACASCQGHRRSVLCGTFRRVAPPGRYPAPCPVESGLSSSAGKCPHARGHPANSFFFFMLCLPLPRRYWVRGTWTVVGPSGDQGYWFVGGPSARDISRVSVMRPPVRICWRASSTRSAVW